MAMARTQEDWNNKECRLSVRAVPQLSFSQATHGVGAPFRGFQARFPSALKLFKNFQATQAIPGAAILLAGTAK